MSEKVAEIKMPEVHEQSDWICELFGVGHSFYMRPRKGKHPNFFWRWMQYIILGNKWRYEPLKELDK